MQQVYAEIAITFEKLSQCYSALAKEACENSRSQENISQVSRTSIEELRELLSKKSKAGKTPQVKELLNKFGAEKLSQVKKEDYEALMLESQGL